ncbi:response regulator transcription factor [Flavobacterium lindanitolerans]|uniref:response regulator transcription factor n=1 Tax=Flavobacterium lindanitolerans TaxID=428988 RepID=UPI0031D8E7E3
MTQIFIVDDHFMVIEGICSLLRTESGIECMGHAMDGASCMAFLEENQPDIILMDINLPDTSGIDLCKIVKKQYPGIAILALSTYSQMPVVRNMLANGASGYLLKNVSKEEILDAIAIVRTGGEYLCMEVAEALKLPQNTEPLITRREKEVLLLICDGFTNPEIAEKLFVSLPTINTHRKSLLSKLKAKNVAALVKIAMQNGIV